MNSHTTDFRLSQVEASLGLEDLALDECTRELLRRVSEGEIDAAELLARHRYALLREVIDNG
jgi:hypothetical protein